MPNVVILSVDMLNGHAVAVMLSVLILNFAFKLEILLSFGAGVIIIILIFQVAVKRFQNV